MGVKGDFHLKDLLRFPVSYPPLFPERAAGTGPQADLKGGA